MMLVWVDVSWIVVVMTVVEDPDPRVYVRVWSPVWTGEFPLVAETPVLKGTVGMMLLDSRVDVMGRDELSTGELPRVEELGVTVEV